MIARPKSIKNAIQNTNNVITQIRIQQVGSLNLLPHNIWLLIRTHSYIRVDS